MNLSLFGTYRLHVEGSEDLLSCVRRRLDEERKKSKTMSAREKVCCKSL